MPTACSPWFWLQISCHASYWNATSGTGSSTLVWSTRSTSRPFRPENSTSKIWSWPWSLETLLINHKQFYLAADGWAVFGGLMGWRPAGVSARMWKCEVGGGPIRVGFESMSTWGRKGLCTVFKEDSNRKRVWIFKLLMCFNRMHARNGAYFQI